jgi:hypothetical protein
VPYSRRSAPFRVGPRQIQNETDTKPTHGYGFGKSRYFKEIFLVLHHLANKPCHNLGVLRRTESENPSYVKI